LNDEEKKALFKAIDEAFDYADPVNHQENFDVKMIESGFQRKKYIVARRYVDSENEIDHSLDLIASFDRLTEKTQTIGLYLNSTLIEIDHLNALDKRKRDSFTLVAKTPAFEKFPYYDREHLKKDMMRFGERAYSKKVEYDAVVQKISGDPFVQTSHFIEGLVIKGGGTIINALPKKGKSFVCMFMAVSVDSGNSTLWPVQQGNALYINLERSASSMVKRLAGVNTALGLDPMRSLRFMNVRGTPLIDILDSIKYQVEKEDIKLIIIDSISRAGMGSLADDKTAVAITDALNRLVEETDRSWVGIAHRAWSNEHVFGSVQFLAACDVMVDIDAAHNEEKELGIKLSVSGLNDLPPTKPKLLALGFDSMGLAHARTASEEEFPALMGDEDSIAERVLQILKSKGRQKVKDVSNELGEKEDSVSKSLRRLQDKRQVVKLPNHFWGAATR